MLVLPRLFKNTPSGLIQYWDISVSEATITREYGQVGTSTPQILVETVKEGKNLGRANATTAVQQAEFEARAEWEKHLKRGFVESIEDCIERGPIKSRKDTAKEPKVFNTGVFKIVGIKEGRGKLQGLAASFICQIKTDTFNAKLNGELGLLRRCYEDHSLWQDKWLEVKYQGLTTYGKPRFPIGLEIKGVEK